MLNVFDVRLASGRRRPSRARTTTPPERQGLWSISTRSATGSRNEWRSVASRTERALNNPVGVIEHAPQCGPSAVLDNPGTDTALRRSWLPAGVRTDDVTTVSRIPVRTTEV
jgi:hypothetical protein